MAKKLVAVTEIRHDNGVTAEGETLDASQFTKSQLEELYDAGAVRIDDGQTSNETQTETAQLSADQSAEASSPATPAPAKSTSAPAVKETANGKGVAK